MRALDFVERLRKVSPAAANAVMTVAVKSIIPLSAVMGFKVEDASDARTQASVPLKRRTRNHVGGVYLGVQVTVMELAMGLWLFRRFPPGRYNALVDKVEVSFHARAKGGVRAVCQPPPEVFSTLDAALRKKGDKAREWIAVRLEDFEGTHVADARFLAVLKRYAPATTEAGAPPPP
jgi:acyl-coenzyme A thioesterase PaaI-like protein